jgi:hypothetical protein
MSNYNCLMATVDLPPDYAAEDSLSAFTLPNSRVNLPVLNLPELRFSVNNAVKPFRKSYIAFGGLQIIEALAFILEAMHLRHYCGPEYETKLNEVVLASPDGLNYAIVNGLVQVILGIFPLEATLNAEGQSIEYLFEIVESLFSTEPGARSRVSLENVLKALTFNVLHHEEALVVLDERSIHLDDVLVAAQSLYLVGLGKQRGEFSPAKILHAFNSYFAAFLLVGSLPHNSKTTVSQQSGDHVAVLQLGTDLHFFGHSALLLRVGSQDFHGRRGTNDTVSEFT